MSIDRAEILRQARQKRQAESGAIQTNPVAKWEASDKSSRVAAINAFCATCMGCDKDYIEPGFRECIRNCTSLNCPLYKFRPYKLKQDDTDSEST